MNRVIRWLMGLSLITLSSLSFAQNDRYDSIALGPKGPVPNAKVAVCTQPAVTNPAPCTPLANLCATLSDVVCGAPNPVTADQLGNYHFYAPRAAAPYTVEIYGPQVAAPYILTDQQLAALAASSVPFSGILTGTNTSATMTLGSGATFTINGGALDGTLGFSQHGVVLWEGTGPSTGLFGGILPGADTVLVGKLSADPAPAAIPSCPDAGGNHLNYALGGTFTCGTTTSAVFTPSFNPPTRVTLGGAIGMSGSVQATILSTSFTTPVASGTYRLLVSYNVWITSGDNLCAAEVIDTTNSRAFAGSGQNANGTGYIGLAASEVSSQTYAANTTITVHLDAECNNGAGGLVGATVNMNGGAVFTMSPAEPTYLSVTAVLTN